MSDVITTTRALMRMFDRSGYADLHLRQDGYELFLSRQAAAANPMRRPTTAPPPPAALPDTLPDAGTAPVAAPCRVTAPHVATLLSALPLGSVVVAGSTVVAQLGLLDEVIEVTSDQGGVVAEVPATIGALLDYGAPILCLAAA